MLRKKESVPLGLRLSLQQILRRHSAATAPPQSLLAAASVQTFANMKFQEILLMLGLCSTVVAGMAANAPSKQPAKSVSDLFQKADKLTVCALKCWENSKYVSSCHSEIQCLCEDAEFQSVRFLRSKTFAPTGPLTFSTERTAMPLLSMPNYAVWRSSSSCPIRVFGLLLDRLKRSPPFDPSPRSAQT